jgi:hypothetical protein
MKNYTRYVLTAGLALLLSFALQVSAQEPTGNIAESWSVTVDRENVREFEAALKANMAFRAEKGDPRTWAVLTPVAGDQLNTYLIRTCCFSWADQDAYESWEAQNPEIMQRWYSEVDPLVADYAHSFSEYDMKNSNFGNSVTPVSLVQVTTWDVRPNQMAEFSAAKTEISQIVLNQSTDRKNRQWAWLETLTGPTRMSLAIPRENFAALSPIGPSLYEFLSDKMGAEKAADLLQRFANSTTSSIHRIWRIRPDLAGQ